MPFVTLSAQSGAEAEVSEIQEAYFSGALPVRDIVQHIRWLGLDAPVLFDAMEQEGNRGQTPVYASLTSPLRAGLNHAPTSPSDSARYSTAPDSTGQ